MDGAPAGIRINKYLSEVDIAPAGRRTSCSNRAHYPERQGA